MEITTSSERLLRCIANRLLDLLFSERNHMLRGVCLQRQLRTAIPGLRPWHDPRTGALHQPQPAGGRQPSPTLAWITTAASLCTRCVRVCDEVEGAHTWDVMGRGAEARIVADLNQPWGESHQLHQLRQMCAGLPHRVPCLKKANPLPKCAKNMNFCPTCA
jgi:bidirectional [NiFe] hydrogenase diaphorase subunit